MTQWYVKDLSKLTDVSVQTLHHYDRIDLLNPSVRLANGYRVYSEKDLLKLQQIIALKFFGFELSQIKALLTADAGVLKHLSAQAQFLDQKAKTLLDASKALKSIISDVNDNQSIPWETIIRLIEVYRMTQKLDHSWVKEIFTPEELKQYVAFETELKSNSTPEQKATFEKNWANLVREIKNNLSQDPRSEIGIQLGAKCMQLINGLYGKKYAHLRTKKFEKGFAEGKGLDEVGLTPETVSWLDKAMDAYWRHRIYGILAKVGKIPSSEVLTLWNEVLDDMYGDDALRKKNVLFDAALQDDKISSEAKKWLNTLSTK
ncbi:MAG: MerR family transcriptional regulator [Gammaproteobacteria bacterium]|nr:MerR family transcriptional regulator [Gammaproteobacteria bacterium]